VAGPGVQWRPDTMVRHRHPPTGPVAAVRRAFEDPVERAAYVLVAVHLAVWCWTVSRSYFRQDDFVYLYRAAQSRLSSDYLLQDYGGHLMPGQFLLFWALVRVAPLSWAVALVFPFALRLVASVGFVRLLVQLFGRRPGILAPLAVFLFCPLVVLPSLWWAAALQALTLQASMVLALLAHVRFLRTGQLRDGLLGVATVAGGLLFWQKALLVPLVLVGVELVARRAGLPVARGPRGRVWVAHAVVVGGYLVAYFSLTQAVGARAAVGDAAEMTREAVFRGFLPGIVGGPWSDDFVGLTIAPTPPLPAVVVAVAIVSAAILVTCLMRPRAAVPAWLLLGVYLGIDLGLVAGLRLDFFGPLIGRDPRYVADAVVVAALVLGLAMLPVAGATAEVAPSRWWARFRAARAGGTGALSPTPGWLVLLPAYLASCLLSTVLATQHMEETAGRDFVVTARQELQRQPGVVVWDGIVPENVMTFLFGADARVSRVLGSLEEPPRFGEPTEDLRMFDGHGRLRPVDMIQATTSPPGPAKDCGYPVHTTRTTTVALLKRLPPGEHAIRLGYYTSVAAAGSVRVEGAGAQPVAFQTGLHYLYLRASGPFDTVDLTLDDSEAGAGVCITDVVVGQPWPRPGT
jgi:hypothetical protein